MLVRLKGVMVAEHFYVVLVHARPRPKNSPWTSAQVHRAATRFYAVPPRCYMLVGAGMFGILACVEWVAGLVISFVSHPFLMGSAEHAAAVASVEDITPLRWGDPLVLPAAELEWTAPPVRAPTAVTAVHGDTFYKLIPVDARPMAWHVRSYHVYSRLAEACRRGAGTRMPAAILPGTAVYFGAHELLVTMPAVRDAEEATYEQLTQDGPVLQAVAEAVAWLAYCAGLVYVDVRGPNVLVERESMTVRLVDFDDCQVVHPTSIASKSDYRAAVRTFADTLDASSNAGTFARVYSGLEGPEAEAQYGALRRAIEAAIRGYANLGGREADVAEAR